MRTGPIRQFQCASALLAVRVTSACSAAAFSGFGDDESGFYQTYTRAFREVWDAERDWGEASSDGSGWGQGSPPEMGGSKDSYETAEEFYGTWSGFVSELSFGWEDEYNVNEVSGQQRQASRLAGLPLPLLPSLLMLLLLKLWLLSLLLSLC